MASEVAMWVTANGPKGLEDMTREELIEAINTLAGMWRDAQQAHNRTLTTWCRATEARASASFLRGQGEG